MEERGVDLRSATGVYSIPVAEWVVTQVLQLYKRSRDFWRHQQEHRWVKNRDLPELAGSTVTIVGFGDIGREVAKRLRGFDVRIVAVNSEDRPSSLADMTFGAADLGAALRIADVVILALPLTPGTRHLIDAAALQLMKPDAVLVDVSRGGIVDQEALLAALDEGRFRGVALDVFEMFALSPLPWQASVAAGPANLAATCYWPCCCSPSSSATSSSRWEWARTGRL
ncbi:NAD(P)-dependent oxidoreductase [Tessaracoccus flavus]|uniref:NAD(P)-dependent oxidoreductase n=1 Tax=Tessaracoccus flavus TaxID=1610493 RepID=UPI00138FC28A|nr:NAD(P)-dependent oxidoreductase [Tessaracoccus flavus]